MCCIRSINNERETELAFGALSEIAPLLCRFIPCGRVALIADGEENFFRARSIRACLKGFESFCVVVGEKESASGLFSLPDDVRAAVAVGNGAFFAARYFCTLRGAYCIAVPDDADLFSAFESPVPLKIAGKRSRYPADPPDAIFCEAGRVRGYGAAYGALCLCALSAFDAEVHSVFSGGDVSPFYRKLFEGALRLEPGKGRAFEEELLSLSARHAALRRDLKRRADTEVFYNLLCGRLRCERGAAALFAYRYLCERYRYFFKCAAPRAFFVPDYPRRIRAAAAYAGEDERALFLKNKPPSAKRTYELAQTFRESRAAFCVKAEEIALRAERVKSALFFLGARAPKIEAVRANEAFSAAAELSDTLSVPSLMRDFGLLI